MGRIAGRGGRAGGQGRQTWSQAPHLRPAQGLGGRGLGEVGLGGNRVGILKGGGWALRRHAPHSGIPCRAAEPHPSRATAAGPVPQVAAPCKLLSHQGVC